LFGERKREKGTLDRLFLGGQIGWRKFTRKRCFGKEIEGGKRSRDEKGWFDRLLSVSHVGFSIKSKIQRREKPWLS